MSVKCLSLLLISNYIKCGNACRKDWGKKKHASTGNKFDPSSISPRKDLILFFYLIPPKLYCNMHNVCSIFATSSSVFACSVSSEHIGDWKSRTQWAAKDTFVGRIQKPQPLQSPRVDLVSPPHLAPAFHLFVHILIFLSFFLQFLFHIFKKVHHLPRKASPASPSQDEIERKSGQQQRRPPPPPQQQQQQEEEEEDRNESDSLFDVCVCV